MGILGKKSRCVLAIAVLLCSLGGILWSHMNLVVFEAESDAGPEIYYVPEARNLKPILMGHEAVLADLIWIRTLGYFADEVTSGGRFRFLERLVSLAADLDPRFEQVYIWAGAVLMYNSGRISREKIEASNRILKKGWDFIQSDPVGWRHDPRYWMIPQMLGFNYAIELRDRKSGAPYIAAVARIPESPAVYKTWAATLYSKAGEVEEGVRVLEDVLAIDTLEGQLASVKESSIKRQIQDRLGFYYRKLYGEHAAERIALLERQIERLFEQWRTLAPYVSFDQFLALRPDENDERETLRSEQIWTSVFP